MQALVCSFLEEMEKIDNDDRRDTCRKKPDAAAQDDTIREDIEGRRRGIMNEVKVVDDVDVDWRGSGR